VSVGRQQLLAKQPAETDEQASSRDVQVAVHETRLIQMILGGIQQIGGFERPEWLE
jgi:hypothetical protein